MLALSTSLIVASLAAQTHRIQFNQFGAASGGIVFREKVANGNNVGRLLAPDSIAATFNLYFPSADGDLGLPITTDGAGGLDFRATIQSQYVFSKYSELHLEQRGGALGWSHLYLRNQVGDIGGRFKCDDIDVCDLTLEGDTNKLAIRMEGRSGVKYTPAAFGGSTDPEFQLGDQASYPAGLSLAINKNAVTVLAGKPMLLKATDGTFTGWSAGTGSENTPYVMPVNAMAAGDCIKGLNAAAHTTEWGSCGAAGSFELPVYFTTSGVNKIGFLNFLGNTRMFMQNSSGIDGVQLETFFGGAQLALFDTNGDGKFEVYTGDSSNGAMAKWYQADTARVGVQIEAGAFTGETGRIRTRDYLDNQRVLIDDGLHVYVSGASVAAVDITQTSGAGEVKTRDGFGFTKSTMNHLGFTFFGSSPQNFTLNVSCTAGTGTITVSGSIITGKTGSC